MGRSEKQQDSEIFLSSAMWAAENSQPYIHKTTDKKKNGSYPSLRAVGSVDVMCSIQPVGGLITQPTPNKERENDKCLSQASLHRTVNDYWQLFISSCWYSYEFISEEESSLLLLI